MTYFKPKYRECFLVCNTKQSEDGSFVLDLPFPITSQQVYHNGICYYHECPKMIAEVMAHVTYDKSHHNDVVKYDGYIAENNSKSNKDKIKGNKHFPLPTEDEDGNPVPFISVFLTDEYEDK